MIVQNRHFGVRTLNLGPKMATIGPIMHKNVIKHENTGFKAFLASKAPKIFSRPLNLDIMGFFRPEGVIPIAGFWPEGGSIVGFPADAGLVHPCI